MNPDLLIGLTAGAAFTTCVVIVIASVIRWLRAIYVVLVNINRGQNQQTEAVERIDKIAEAHDRREANPWKTR